MQRKIEDERFEKVPIPATEPYHKTLGRIFMRELRLLYAGLHSAFSEPIILLKRTFISTSVDRAVRPAAQSYELQPSKFNGVGILLCHGFASTPEIFSELAPKLLDQGYIVRAIRLSGHGTTPGHLAQTSGVDWFATVVWHYKELRKKTDTIYYVGHSLGGTLGLLLGTIYDLKGIVTMCTPIKLHIPPAKFVRQASLIVKYWPRSRRRRKMLDDVGWSTYRVSPLFAIAGIFEVGKILRSRSEKLNKPVLFISSGKDHKTLLPQPEEMKSAFPNNPTEFRHFENSPHTILIGPDKIEVMELISNWIDNRINSNS